MPLTIVQHHNRLLSMCAPDNHRDRSAPSYLNHQYRDASKLDARARLYRYGTAVVPFRQWTFDQLQPSLNEMILDIGCGAGDLWSENIDRVPGDARIHLVDRASGILSTAKTRIGDDQRFHYTVADAQSFHDDRLYDTVFAGFVLYFMLDPIETVHQLAKRLRPTGRFIASTPSNNNLVAMWQLFNDFDENVEPYDWSTLRFSAENGEESLAHVFKNIERRDYRTTIRVPDPAPVVDYILSIYDGTIKPDLSCRREALEKHFQECAPKWPLVLQSMSCVFVCSDPWLAET